MPMSGFIHCRYEGGRSGRQALPRADHRECWASLARIDAPAARTGPGRELRDGVQVGDDLRALRAGGAAPSTSALAVWMAEPVARRAALAASPPAAVISDMSSPVCSQLLIEELLGHPAVRMR